MAALSPTTMQGPGQRLGVLNTLTASDTFTYTPNGKQYLFLFNPTGGTISPVITSDGAVNFTPPGLGVSLNVTSGITVAVPAGQAAIVPLDQNPRFLTPSTVVTITAGTSLLAFLLSS